MAIDSPIIAIPTVSDQAILTSTHYTPELPVTNLQNMDPSLVARSVDESGSFNIDLGAEDIPVRLIWLGYTNLTDTSTWRVRADNDFNNVTVSPAYDSGTLSTWDTDDISSLKRPHATLWLNAATTLRYWRVNFNNVSAAYTDIGRLYMADPWQSARGHDFGWSIQNNELGQVSRTMNGRGVPSELGHYRTLKYTISFMNEYDMIKEPLRLELSRRMHKDVLVIRDPTDVNVRMEETIYGYFNNPTPYTNQLLNYYRKVFEFQEVEMP